MLFTTLAPAVLNDLSFTTELPLPINIIALPTNVAAPPINVIALFINITAPPINIMASSINITVPSINTPMIF